MAVMHMRKTRTMMIPVGMHMQQNNQCQSLNPSFVVVWRPVQLAGESHFEDLNNLIVVDSMQR
jgi:hypothetical protein